MKAYAVNYQIRGKEDLSRTISIDAKDLQSAKKKIGKKHGYKDGRMVSIVDYRVIGYF